MYKDLFHCVKKQVLSAGATGMYWWRGNTKFGDEQFEDRCVFFEVMPVGESDIQNLHDGSQVIDLQIRLYVATQYYDRPDDGMDFQDLLHAINGKLYFYQPRWGELAYSGIALGSPEDVAFASCFQLIGIESDHSEGEVGINLSSLTFSTSLTISATPTAAIDSTQYIAPNAITTHTGIEYVDQI